MNEGRNGASFAGGSAAGRGCGRTEEFVTFLYGESTPEESGAFRRHLESCDVCREELSALGGVREAVGVWRADALGSLPSLNIADTLAPLVELRRPRLRERSAAAALREFFTLSPLWLRAGAVAATLAVCALSALTLARTEVTWGADGLAFRTGVTERVVGESVVRESVVREQAATPAQALYTEEQVNAIVERRVAEVAARPVVREPSKVIDVSGGGERRTRAGVQDAPPRKRAPRPEVLREEPLLAADELPRLSDLLGDSY